MKTVKSANLHGINDLRYEDTPLPIRGDDEVLLRVKCCGICGSDISRVYTKGTYHFPTIIGHEFSGEIADAQDKNMISKRAVVFPLIPCFKCSSCKEKNYATCSNYDYYGSRRDGGMTEYIAVKEWNIVPMPDGLSFDEGAMCEPVSVARHATLKLDITPGDCVMISGAGPIGLVAGQWAKAFGAAKVIYTDIDKRKLDFAKQLGFNEYTEDTSADCFIEGTGYSDALEKCLRAANPRARGVLMGNPAGEITMLQDTYWYILRKELQISGTWNSSYNDVQNDWKESLKAMANGTIDVKKLITHRFPLSECNTAFEMMKNRKEFYNKVMLYTEVK